MIRLELAVKAVPIKGVSIALACRVFKVSETCYRHSSKLDCENEQSADLLLGPAAARRAWGLGPALPVSTQLPVHKWNHKQGYRTYRELELSLHLTHFSNEDLESVLLID